MNSNKGFRGPCEASKEIVHAFGHPVIVKCERPGRWREYGVMPFGSVLCDDCYVSMLLNDAVRRNEAALERLGD